MLVKYNGYAALVPLIYIIAYKAVSHANNSHVLNSTQTYINKAIHVLLISTFFT